MILLKYWRRDYYKRVYYKKTLWTQPTLSANGTMGGASFAVSASAATNPAYYAFDSNSATYWRSGTALGWIQFYNPIPLLVSNIRWGYFYNYPIGGTVQGSNDGTTWDTVASWSNSAAADFDIQLSSNIGYKHHRINITGVNRDVIHSTQLSITAETVSVGTVSDYSYYVDSAGTVEDYTYYTDTQVSSGDSYTHTTETEIANGNIGGNLRYGRRLFGRHIFAGSIKTAGGDDTPSKFLPGVFKIIAYNADGTKSAIFGAGANNNAVSEFNFKIIETGCGECTIKFNKLPTNAELNYKQRVDIHLFNDNQPWFSGYVITRPIVGTTETSFSFAIHGFYNLLEKVQLFETYENMEVSAIVKSIAQTVETKLGLVYNADKIINTGYTITKIVFDGVDVKKALEQLSDFGLDYVFGVDEKRSIYFKPRNTEINEQARFWVSKHLTSYVPNEDVEKVCNWARIKGASIDISGESWLATVQDLDSQAAYGLQEEIWTLPSAYASADAERWGNVQIQRYKDPIRSAKIKGVDLRYLNADGSFNVRKLSTDGECVITTLDGSAIQYPITSLKYTVSAEKGIQCEMELGEQPFKIDTYFAELERNNKNNELLQQASNKQLI